VNDLVSRLIHGRGLNYWEAGMDVHAADNLYDSFIKYQSELGLMFDQLAQEYDFVTINAGRPVMEVFADLKAKIRDLLEDEQPIFSETL